MLSEIKHINQHTGEPFRRWFWSRRLDLTVWYSDSGDIVGFQLSYRIGTDEKALTWRSGRGYSHNSVDSGEDAPARPKKTPLLVADGVFDRDTIVDMFIAESAELDVACADFIIEKLKSYREL